MLNLVQHLTKSRTYETLKQVQGDRLGLFTSSSTVEIERTPNLRLRGKMQETITSFTILSVTDRVEWLAREYIRQQAVPEGYAEDAYHIAIAVLNEIDYLLSWNFKHIVRKTTRDIVRLVNTQNNLKQIEIMTPAELL